MSKPEDHRTNFLAEISESQWAHADALVNFIRCPKTDYSRLVAVVARAIMAAKAEERESIAKMADALAKSFEPGHFPAKDNPYKDHDIGRRDGAAEVAAAIRKRGET